MAGKTAKFEYDFLRMIFNGTAITNWASTGGSTSLWLSLHTADPGEAGSTANEGGYTEYTRVKTDRSSAASTGWGVSSGNPATVAPTGTVSFPAMVSGSSGTFTHAAVWPSSNATGSSAIYYGTISPNINFTIGVTPQITTGSSITEA
jgi:hypothetical protein